MSMMRVVPETPNLGAVVQGLDAKMPLDQTQIQELKVAILKYKVLFFPNQNLDRSEHLAFAKQFGEVFVNTSRFPNPYDEEGIANVTVVPGFHADVMYNPEGPTFSFLQMLELPTVGGDTIWVDLVASYNDLSRPFRDFLETLSVLQGVSDYDLSDDELRDRYMQRRGLMLSAEDLKELREELAPWEAPLVRVIPETGSKNYWIAAKFTRAVKGMSTEESQTILSLLFRHQLHPKYAYRWRWGVGDVAFWDHRTTLHSGVTDYGTARRFGNRISIIPNRPVPARASQASQVRRGA